MLVVEDDERVRKITVKRLKHLGYEIIEAESGPKALDVLVKADGVDVVFTDIAMPCCMTAADVLAQVQAEYPHIKRLITSGYAEDGTIPNDGTLWLRKPYSLEEMSRTFRQLLD